MYQNISFPEDKIVTVNNGCMDKIADHAKGRLLLKHGYVVDPFNQFEGEADIAIENDTIQEIAENITQTPTDSVIDCKGLLVIPGLIDMHLHMGDLFEITTDSIKCAVEDGVTVGLSPGAGNTFMAPALLAAEVDRGLPMSVGVYLGAANVLGSSLSVAELIALFQGKLNREIAFRKMSRNAITNMTAPFIVGIKDHMGHFIMSDDNIEKVFQITSQANLLYMSHTQDPEHAKRMFSLSNGRPLHLGHMTAVGAGTHGDALKSMREVIALCNSDNVTGEFVTTMIRAGLGSREGLQMTQRARLECLEALSGGVVDILVSDGQNQSTMKGFGDTRDNIPALLELVEDNVLSLSQSVATMTCNPCKLFAKRTKNNWWTERLGHLGKGALANITIIDKKDKLATYTIVNGKIVAFENRLVRSGYSAGSFVSKFGIVHNMGIGNFSMLQ